MIELQDKLWNDIIQYLPLLSAEQLDKLKSNTTAMLQDLDLEKQEGISKWLEMK